MIGNCSFVGHLEKGIGITKLPPAFHQTPQTPRVLGNNFTHLLCIKLWVCWILTVLLLLLHTSLCDSKCHRISSKLNCRYLQRKDRSFNKKKIIKEFLYSPLNVIQTVVSILCFTHQMFKCWNDQPIECCCSHYKRWSSSKLAKCISLNKFVSEFPSPNLHIGHCGSKYCWNQLISSKLFCRYLQRARNCLKNQKKRNSCGQQISDRIKIWFKIEVV